MLSICNIYQYSLNQLIKLIKLSHSHIRISYSVHCSTPSYFFKCFRSRLLATFAYGFYLLFIYCTSASNYYFKVFIVFWVSSLTFYVFSSWTCNNFLSFLFYYLSYLAFLALRIKLSIFKFSWKSGLGA